jgi:hypothetical protein
MDSVSRILTQPGYGGFIVLALQALCFAFYGALIVWIVRGGRKKEG